MKKKLYLLPLLFLVLLLQTACSDEPITMPVLENEFDVDIRFIDFPAQGGTKTISIISETEVDWEAYASISWLTLGEPDYVNGTITIIAEPSREIDKTKGAVTVYAKPDKSVKVQVTRSGLGIIHGRSSLSRMNLRGDISELSYYLNPRYLFDLENSELTDLKFNENGMLVSFKNDFKFSDDLMIIYTNTLTYDSKNRLAKFEAISETIIEGSGEQAKYTMDFSYGNHGKYIDPNLFTFFFQFAYCNGDFRAWLPKMIKDLTKIDIYSNAMEYPNCDIEIDISGVGGSASFNYTEADEPQTIPFSELAFDGSFLKQASFMETLMGMLLTFVNEYEIDAQTGNVLSITRTVPDFGPETISQEKYTADISNQLLYQYDMFIGYDMEVTCNDKMDIIKMDNPNMIDYFGEYEYLYDAKGNWTNIKATRLQTGHITELDKTRTITYR